MLYVTDNREGYQYMKFLNNLFPNEAQKELKRLEPIVAQVS
ncbi:MAG: hypothetical protein UY04_C0020G0001, partial [Parcubacteria group bacterium GW2011_GWA2_47_7]